MSYRPHLSKNKNTYPDQYGQQWWYVEIWPNGRKRDKTGKLTGERITFKFFGTEAAVRIFDIEQQRKPVNQLLHLTNPTIRDILPQFLDYYRLEVVPGTMQDFIRSSNHLIPHFGDMRFNQITNTVVLGYKNLRLAQTWQNRPTTRRTINKELAYLSSIIKWAQREDPPLCDSSIRIILFPRKQTKSPIQTTHTFEEINHIIAETGRTRTRGHHQHAADIQALATLMYDAGLRRNEACTLTKERISLPDKPIDLPGNINYYGVITVIRKGGKESQLPILTNRLYEQLKNQSKTVKTGYLYINPMTGTHYKNIRGGLKGASQRAGVDKRITHHLLRHDFVTHLHQSGVDLKTIQGLAGHADIQTTMDIYNHLESSTMRQRAGNFTDKIDNQPTREI